MLGGLVSQLAFQASDLTRFISCYAGNYGVAAVETGGKRLSTGQSHLMVRVSPQLKNGIPH